MGRDMLLRPRQAVAGCLDGREHISLRACVERMPAVTGREPKSPTVGHLGPDESGVVLAGDGVDALAERVVNLGPRTATEKVLGHRSLLTPEARRGEPGRAGQGGWRLGRELRP